MAPLTMPELRQLARLHRAGVEGAAEQLEVVVRERGEELAELLRFPKANLARVAETDDAPALVAATIKGAPRLRRDALQRSRRASTSGLAETLCRISERRADGSIELHAPLLADLLHLWGPGYIVFGDLGSISVPRLKALLRECRHVVSRAVILTESALLVFYETERSRGAIRLHLQRVVFDVDALHIPIEQVPTQPSDTTDPDVPLADEPQCDITARPAAARRRRRGFIERFVEVALAAALGGAP